MKYKLWLLKVNVYITLGRLGSVLTLHKLVVVHFEKW